MKKTLFAVMTLALTLTAASAMAAEKMGSLGFHSYSAPIGGRYWFSDKVGVDVGVGFSSQKSDYNAVPANPATSYTNKYSMATVDLGLDYCALKWERVRFIARPGFQYRTQKYDYDKNYSSTKYKYNYMYLTGELEAEIMVADNVSVSASHGLAWSSQKQTLTNTTTGQDIAEYKTTYIYSFGNGWTSVGFHVYLF